MQGLSEPVGALLALLFIKPFLTPLLLQYMLAFVGGIMVRIFLSDIMLPCTKLAWHQFAGLCAFTQDHDFYVMLPFRQ